MQVHGVMRDVIATSILGVVARLSPLEIAELGEFLHMSPVHEFMHSLRDVLYAPAQELETTVESSLHLLERTKRYRETVFDHPLYLKVAEINLTRGDLVRIGRMLQPEIPDDEAAYNLPVIQLVERKLQEIDFAVAETLSPQRLAPLEELLTDVRVMSQTHGAYASRFFLDTARAIIRADIDELLANHAEVDEESGITSRLLQFETCDPPILQELKTHAALFANVSSSERYRIVQLAMEPQPSHVDEIEEVLGVLQDFGDDVIRSVQELLFHTDSYERVGLLSTLSDEPAFIALYASILPYKITTDSYLDFMYRDLPPELLSGLVAGSKVTTKAKAIASLVRGIEYIPAGVEKRLAQIIMNNGVTTGLVSDCVDALRNHEANKAEILMKLGELHMSGQELKTIRALLSETDDRDIPQEYSSLSELVRKLRQPAESTARPQARGHEEIPASIRYTESDAALIERATLLLAPYAKQFQTLRRHNPEHVPVFCREVLEFHGSPTFQFFMGNDELLSLYRARLGNHEVINQLEEVLGQTWTNPYGVIRRALQQSIEPLSRHDEPQMQETEHVLPFSRIVVYGGQFTQERASSLQQEVPGVELDLRDLFRYKSVETLRQDDLVIVILPYLHTPAIRELRFYCKTHGIQLKPFDHQGYKPLAEYIQRLVQAHDSLTSEESQP